VNAHFGAILSSLVSYELCHAAQRRYRVEVLILAADESRDGRPVRSFEENFRQRVS
jgi:hypothetical protein